MIACVEGRGALVADSQKWYICCYNYRKSYETQIVPEKCGIPDGGGGGGTGTQGVSFGPRQPFQCGTGASRFWEFSLPG